MQNPLTITGLDYGSTNLLIPDGTPFEEWVEIGKQLAKCKRAAAFWIADHRRFGMASYDDDQVADGLEQIHFDLGDEKLTSALSKYEGPRNESLTAEHHFVVAKLEENEKRTAWLDTAAEHKLTPAQLQKAIFGPPKPKTEGIASPHAVSMQFMFWRRQIGDNWETLNVEQLSQIINLLEPIEEFLIDLKNQRFNLKTQP
jgi:hypothetical protein